MRIGTIYDMLSDSYFKSVILNFSKYLVSAPGHLKVKECIKTVLSEKELIFYLTYELPSVNTHQAFLFIVKNDCIASGPDCFNSEVSKAFFNGMSLITLFHVKKSNNHKTDEFLYFNIGVVCCDQGSNFFQSFLTSGQ